MHRFIPLGTILLAGLVGNGSAQVKPSSPSLWTLEPGVKVRLVLLDSRKVTSNFRELDGDTVVLSRVLYRRFAGTGYLVQRIATDSISAAWRYDGRPYGTLGLWIGASVGGLGLFIATRVFDAREGGCNLGCSLGFSVTGAAFASLVGYLAASLKVRWEPIRLQ